MPGSAVLRLRSITPDKTFGPVLALLALAAASWVVSGERMHGMDMGPGSDLGTFGFYVVTWIVMMAAMMLPSVTPMVTGYVRLQNGRGSRSRGSTAAFVAGYLTIWTLFGLVAYAVFEGVRQVTSDWLSWDRGGRWVTVAILVIAAGYQLSPAKDACLRGCRSTIPFLTREWRNGRIGAVRMGGLHGAWCTGCCWALMAALFALGSMSLTWMAVGAAVIAAEKLLPRPRTTTLVVSGLLVILGAAIALTPSNVPGLTVPGSHAMPRGMVSEPHQAAATDRGTSSAKK